MKTLLILFINLFFPVSLLAQEPGLRCELQAMGGSILGFVTHGFIAFLVFAFFMKWARQLKKATRHPDLESVAPIEESKRAA